MSDQSMLTIKHADPFTYVLFNGVPVWRIMTTGHIAVQECGKDGKTLLNTFPPVEMVRK